MSSKHLLSVDSYLNTAYVPPDERIPYGSLDLQFGDLYLPASSGPHRVVVLLHGGCWRAKYGLEPMGQFARALADRGVAVWSLEYRRVAGDSADEQAWPQTFVDVAAGCDFLRQLATAYSLDLSRVVAAGHSAGGQLALWLAGRRKLSAENSLYISNPLPIRSVVAIAPVCDLERAIAWDICSGAIEPLMGGGPSATWANYAQGSPSNLLPLGVPHCSINGEEDPIVPIDYVAHFIKTAQLLGDPATLVRLPAVGHFEPVLATHSAGQTVIQAILDQL